MEALKFELGAATAADKESLSLDELHALAKEQEIPGRSSMQREELVVTVAPEQPAPRFEPAVASA